MTKQFLGATPGVTPSPSQAKQAQVVWTGQWLVSFGTFLIYKRPTSCPDVSLTIAGTICGRQLLTKDRSEKWVHCAAYYCVTVEHRTTGAGNMDNTHSLLLRWWRFRWSNDSFKCTLHHWRPHMNANVALWFRMWKLANAHSRKCQKKPSVNTG